MSRLGDEIEAALQRGATGEEIDEIVGRLGAPLFRHPALNALPSKVTWGCLKETAWGRIEYDLEKGKQRNIYLEPGSISHPPTKREGWWEPMPPELLQHLRGKFPKP